MRHIPLRDRGVAGRTEFRGYLRGKALGKYFPRGGCLDGCCDVVLWWLL